MLIVAYPLAQSYEHRIRFLSNWKAIFTSIAIAGGIFLAWDELFTSIGVWGFNERYLIGAYIGQLPIEEYGFFITVPFACLFIYEVLNYYVKRDLFNQSSLAIAWFFLFSLIFLGVFFYPKLYTTVCFFFTALLLAAQVFVYRSAWLGRFFLTYFVCLLPFTLMNTWLTGGFTEDPIVWYNNFETIGVRLGSIPLEDAFYQLGYLLLVVGIYERSKPQKKSSLQSI